MPLTLLAHLLLAKMRAASKHLFVCLLCSCRTIVLEEPIPRHTGRVWAHNWTHRPLFSQRTVSNKGNFEELETSYCGWLPTNPHGFCLSQKDQCSITCAPKITTPPVVDLLVSRHPGLSVSHHTSIILQFL